MRISSVVYTFGFVTFTNTPSIPIDSHGTITSIIAYLNHQDVPLDTTYTIIKNTP